MTNKEIVEEVFAALGEGDARPLVRAMRDDFRWTVRGKTRWSRSYEGRQAVVEELFAMLQAAMQDRIRTVPDRFVAEGDTVVVLAHGENTAKDGRPYENEYCFVIRLEDGRFAELDEYTDTLLVDQVLG